MNVATFLVRMENFFRHPLAAANVPQGRVWSREVAAAHDPWADGFWVPVACSSPPWGVIPK